MAVAKPQYKPENVLVGLASMFLQPYNPSAPPALPADTVMLNEDWGAPWTPIGATSEGVTFGGTRETQNIPIEEQMTPVDIRTTSATYSLSVTLAEDTLQTMLWAFGGGTISTKAATTTEPGVDTLVFSDEMQLFAAGFEGVNADGYWKRVLIPKVKSAAEIETPYRRAEAPRTYATTFQSLVAPSELVIKSMKAPATG